ncbi:MAG: hypothetical protein GY839_19385 [candidate division Zixibacteria bacterium]|nr:hypothetical protein [candidate division Zixibacteria bacterium]
MTTTISTDDFYLAAYLLVNDIPLTGHSRADNKSTFEFMGDNLDDLLNNYYQGKAMVSPVKYARGIRSLKALMYNNTTLQPTTNYEQSEAKGLK